MGAPPRAGARHDHVRRVAARGGRRRRRRRENLRSYLADGFLTKPAHSFSLLQGLWVIAGAGGTYELFAAEQCLAYRVVGGSQLIPIRMAEELGERVVLGAPVRAIRWRDGGVEVDAGARSRRGARRGRRGRAEPRRDDPLRARAAGLAHAAPAGELAGERHEVPRRLRPPVLARGRPLGRGLRAVRARARALRQHAAVGLRRRSLHVPPRRAGRSRRAHEPGCAARGDPRGHGGVRRPGGAPRDGSHRDGLVGRGVDARRVRVDVRDRRAHALRARTCAARSGRSTGRARTSPASGTCTWRAPPARAKRPPPRSSAL